MIDPDQGIILQTPEIEEEEDDLLISHEEEEREDPQELLPRIKSTSDSVLEQAKILFRTSSGNSVKL